MSCIPLPKHGKRDAKHLQSIEEIIQWGTEVDDFQRDVLISLAAICNLVQRVPQLSTASTSLGKHAITHLPDNSDGLSVDVPAGLTVGDAQAAGTDNSYSRSDHGHAVPVDDPSGLSVGDIQSPGVSGSFVHSDHGHAVPVGPAPALVGVSSSVGVATTFVRSDHVHGIDPNAAPFDDFVIKNPLTDTRNDITPGGSEDVALRCNGHLGFENALPTSWNNASARGIHFDQCANELTDPASFIAGADAEYNPGKGEQNLLILGVNSYLDTAATNKIIPAGTPGTQHLGNTILDSTRGAAQLWMMAPKFDGAVGVDSEYAQARHASDMVYFRFNVRNDIAGTDALTAGNMWALLEMRAGADLRGKFVFGGDTEGENVGQYTSNADLDATYISDDAANAYRVIIASTHAINTYTAASTGGLWVDCNGSLNPPLRATNSSLPDGDLFGNSEAWWGTCEFRNHAIVFDHGPTPRDIFKPGWLIGNTNMPWYDLEAASGGPYHRPVPTFRAVGGDENGHAETGRISVRHYLWIDTEGPESVAQNGPPITDPLTMGGIRMSDYYILGVDTATGGNLVKLWNINALGDIADASLAETEQPKFSGNSIDMTTLASGLDSIYVRQQGNSPGAVTQRQGFTANGIDVGSSSSGGIHFGDADPSIVEFSNTLLFAFSVNSVQMHEDQLYFQNAGAVISFAGNCAFDRDGIDWTSSPTLNTTLTPSEGLVVTNAVVSSAYPVLAVISSNVSATRSIFEVEHTGGLTPFIVTRLGVSTFLVNGTHTLEVQGSNPWIFDISGAAVGTLYDFRLQGVTVMEWNTTGSILNTGLTISSGGNDDLVLTEPFPEFKYGATDSATPNILHLIDRNTNATGKLTQRFLMENESAGRGYEITQIDDGAGIMAATHNWNIGQDSALMSQMAFVDSNVNSASQSRYHFESGPGQFLEFVVQLGQVSFLSSAGADLRFTPGAGGVLVFDATGTTLDIDATTATINSPLTFDGAAANRRITPGANGTMLIGDTGSNVGFNLTLDTNAGALTVFVPGSVLAGAAPVGFTANASATMGMAFVTNSGAITLTPATNVVVSDGKDLQLGTTTGTKLGTATTQKLGFWNATPVVRPTAYSRSYSTADKTLAAYTLDDESGAYTGIDNAQGGTPYAQLTDLNALRTAYENLRAFVEDGVQMLNSVVDDLQATGFVG